ncbi:MAG: proline dehydrogenase family protein [Ardenticatenaceae bacterium]|nr:proline dehydrogenase family protein [Anaerolineales bacterium]MCB8941519.1 proline dehydrogenase family protein [Ardenticatenaceae bacterium]MCB8974587.1 proline dehydrogenase family protein [Ardenticatenaceae bacterium]
MQQNKSPLTRIFIFLTTMAVTAVLLYRYGEQWLRSLILYLSTAGWARQIATDFPPAWQVASRFIAGQTSQDAIRATQEVNQQGLSATLNFLGESVNTPEDAAVAREEIIQLLQHIHQSGVNATVSVKPTQLGIHIGPEVVHENLQLLLTAAEKYDTRIRIDMEDSHVTDTTLNLYRRLRDEDQFGHRVGIVLQAYLYRTQDDVEALLQEGAWVRLCKGAYKEPHDLAFAEKADTDANFLHLSKRMLSDEARVTGMFPCFATHDEALIREIIQYTRQHQVDKESFEFQMLYGVRRDLQEEINAEGYRVRVYIPFGTAWYPYFMRRLAERPANLWFFLSNLLR